MTSVCFVAPNIHHIFSKDRSAALAGGAEVQQSFIARGLRDAGYRVSVVTDDFKQPDEFEWGGVHIIRINRRGPEIPIVRNVHPSLTSIWLAVRRANADIYIQSCVGRATAVVGLFAKRHRRLFVYRGASDVDFQRNRTKEVFPTGQRGARRAVWLFQKGLLLAHAVVAQHAGQAEAYRQWYRRDATVIPSCYAPPTDAGASSDGYVLWVSTLRDLKRPELFLELARNLPHLRFRMVGGPATGKDAVVYARTKEAADTLPNVEFVGFVPYTEVEKHFNEARLFVNTSDFEGFPNTFLQSWARGIPTVSFVDCGAREGGRPIGTIAGDMQEMTASVERLCADRLEWQREGERARRYFEANHSVDVAVAHYDRLIRQLLDSRGES